MSHTEPMACHFFTSLDTHDAVGTGKSGYLQRNLQIHFLYKVFFLTKDLAINTCCSVVNFISVDLSTNAIYCTAATRSGMTQYVIWSYVSHLWEICMTEVDCADWWKGSGYWGKTTNQSLKI
jgi:hypothetical protein